VGGDGSGMVPTSRSLAAKGLVSDEHGTRPVRRLRGGESSRAFRRGVGCARLATNRFYYILLPLLLNVSTRVLYRRVLPELKLFFKMCGNGLPRMVTISRFVHNAR